MRIYNFTENDIQSTTEESLGEITFLDSELYSDEIIVDNDILSNLPIELPEGLVLFDAKNGICEDGVIDQNNVCLKKICFFSGVLSTANATNEHQ